MDDMRTAMKTGFLLGGITILLYANRIRRGIMYEDDDIEIPEFMQPVLCDTRSCTKRAIPKLGKCIECAYDELLPLLHDDLEDMLRPKK